MKSQKSCFVNKYVLLHVRSEVDFENKESWKIKMCLNTAAMAQLGLENQFNTLIKFLYIVIIKNVTVGTSR